MLAEVVDNDRAGLIIVESDGNTTVLEGAPPYGIVDTYTVAPTMAPALYTNVKVTLFFDDDNLIVTSTDPRFDPLTRTMIFDWTNWTVPVVVQVAVRDHEHALGREPRRQSPRRVDLPRRHERRSGLHQRVRLRDPALRLR